LEDRHALHRLERLVRGIAAFVGIVTAIAIPTAFGITGYMEQGRFRSFQAHLAADRLAEYAYVQGPTWRFSDHRIAELLAAITGPDDNLRLTVHDRKGTHILTQGAAFTGPALSKQVPIIVSGEPVGDVAAEISLWPMLVVLALQGMVGLALGLGAFLCVNLLPLRALRRTFGNLTHTQEELRQQVDRTNTALDEAREKGRVAERAVVELAAAVRHADEASQTKSRFLASASHDLRQPLQSVILFANRLERHIQDKAGIEKLGHLERGLDSLKSLLDSLLDMSQLETSALKLTVETFPLVPLIEHIGSSYVPVAQGKGLELTMALATPGTIVRSDRILLGRMIRNLVENALRYTETGTIRIGCRLESQQVRIEVADTGSGIAPDHLGKIFDEFYQVGNSERDRQHGLGLGLAIVRRLSTLLGHPGEVQSAPGRGSIFSIAVPLAETPSIQRPAAELAPSAPDAGSGRFAVVIDDDAIVLLGLGAILKYWGFDVLAVGSADQALDRLRATSHLPDLILADYRLRGGKIGTDAIVQIREMVGSQVPGIILTGETGAECEQDAAAHGLGIAYKPITPRQLAKVVERHLEIADLLTV